MQRCYQVSRELLKFLNEQEPLDVRRDVSLTWERIHSMGSARIAALLASKRGVDVELSYTAGALHDFGRFVTGKQENHAENGYEPAKAFLWNLNIFSEGEREEIARAVKNHSRKEIVGTPLEEIAKDGDILDCYYLGLQPKKEAHRKRFAALQKELGLGLEENLRNPASD
jgi:uncharacterized protein